jgi:uncharacterized membrane protein YkvA (DUF1232 family)
LENAEDMSDKIAKRSKKPRVRLKGRMRSFLMFLPNMVKLLGRLLTDSRVPTAEKALFVGAIIYVISPIDLIPDIFPFIGQVDDIYLVVLTLVRLINRTSEDVVREHWSGGGDIVALIDSVVAIAPSFLPKRVRRVLETRVELAPAGQILSNITDRRQPVVVEVAESPKINQKDAKREVKLSPAGR